MCGIQGLAQLPNCASDEIAVLLRRMGGTLTHRGPDDWGEFFADGVALGHNRLSILDLEYGAQPMVSEDSNVAIVFNGEIYNYQELWTELEGKGRRFRTDHSDSEVILNGYLEWGLDVFAHLNGMFAIGIWDGRSETLVLARDRAGIKPLYYSEVPEGGIIFASEPKAIIESGLVSTPFAPEALSEYFTYRAVTAPGTFWRNVLKLPAGHVLTYSRANSCLISRFWSPEPGSSTLSLPEAVEAIEAALMRAVQSHLVADVPVGIFLSGGIDSSLIAAFASRLAQPQAFTIGTSGELDETPMAAAVARHFGLHLNSYYVMPGEFLRTLDDWVYFNDDPVSDPSALALMLLSRMARERGMKVMLSGEGSDELFCGYTSYVRYLVLQSITNVPLMPHALRMIRRRLDDRTMDYLEQPGKPTFLGTAHVTTRWMRSRMFVDVNPEVAASCPEFGGPATPLRRALLFDQMIRLPNDILARTDRATMSASIEARVPYLDRAVIEAANSLDDGHCLHPLSFQTKRVLKLILRKYLPKELVYRRKVGFDLPIAGWLREEFRPTVTQFLGDRLIPGINYPFWSRFYEAHRNGSQDYAAPLWAWLVLERWYRRWVEKSSSVQRPSTVCVGDIT